MISEALELCVESGRVRHSWCMCVVSHGYGGMGGGRDGSCGWYAYRMRPRRIVACREMPEHFLNVKRYIDDSRSHRRPGAQHWLGSSRNWSVFLKRP